MEAKLSMTAITQQQHQQGCHARHPKWSAAANNTEES
jgi:hypothetical protein